MKNEPTPQMIEAAVKEAIRLGLNLKYPVCNALMIRLKLYPNIKDFQQLMNIIEREKSKRDPNLKYPIEEFRPQPSLESGISNGFVKFALSLDSLIPVSLDDNDFYHVLFAGASKYGKSFAIFVLCLGLILAGIPVIILEKTSDLFNNLQTFFPDKILVMRSDGSFPFNPLSVPVGYSVFDYVYKIANLIARVFGRKDSGYLLQIKLQELIQKYATNSGCFPCIRDLHNYILSTFMPKGLSQSKVLRDSILRVTGGLIGGSLGKTLNCSRGLIWRELIEKKISLVVQMDNLGAEHEFFLITAVLLQLYIDSRCMPSDDKVVRVVVVIDEAAIPADRKWDRDGIGMLAELVTVLRHGKINLILATQVPHLLSDTIIANISTPISFRLNEENDVTAIKKVMCLSHEQASCLPLLQPQECVMRLNRWPAPFMARIPDITIPKA